MVKILSRTFLWSFFALSPLYFTAQVDSTILAPSDTIPFTLTSRNNIIVKATLNHADTLALMFHTAASFMTLTEEAVKKTKTLKPELCIGKT